MKKLVKRICAFSLAAIMLFTMTSCGEDAKFNNIGTTIGNILNGAEVTSQGTTTYYIKDGDMYKTNDVKEEGEKIKEGDLSCINITGEKIYYYDNSISTICKCNTSGEKVDRIAEIYCDNFVICKDNIYAMVLTGQGSDDMEDPDNYNIVKMKITDKKLTSTMPKSVVEKGKLLGCIGDNIIVEKNTDTGRAVFKTDLIGENESKIMDISKDAKVVGDSKGFMVLGTVDKQFGLYSYDVNGKNMKLLSKVTKSKSRDGNAINMDSEYVYYEDYTANKVIKKNKKNKKNKKVTTSNNLIKIKRDGSGKEVVMKNSKNMDYKIAIGYNGVMVKIREEGNLDANPKWIGLKDAK